jgi:hypothetical protein
VIQALREVPRFKRVVFIDSDAIVYDQTRPLDFLYDLSEAQFGKNGSALTMFSNRPYARWSRSPACSGIQLWRNGHEALRIAQRWWQSPGLNTEHDYEQSVLWFYNPTLIERFVSSIGVFQAHTFLLAKETDYAPIAADQMFLHIGSAEARFRAPCLSAFMRQHHIPPINRSAFAMHAGADVLAGRRGNLYPPASF